MTTTNTTTTHPAPFAVLGANGFLLTASSLEWAERKLTAFTGLVADLRIVPVTVDGDWFWYGERPAFLG